MAVKPLRELAAHAAARNLPIGPLALPAELITMIHHYVCLSEVGEAITLCTYYAHIGRLDLLAKAHGDGYPWDGHTCLSATTNTTSDCLRYAHENGCPWDMNTCATAAKHGSLECLRYAHENGCPWNEDTCDWAAWCGSFECLRYAHENGCPWGTGTSESAAWCGSLKCLRYAHTNGCPWDKEACKIWASDPEVIAWIDLQP